MTPLVSATLIVADWHHHVLELNQSVNAAFVDRFGEPRLHAGPALSMHATRRVVAAAVASRVRATGDSDNARKLLADLGPVFFIRDAPGLDKPLLIDLLPMTKCPELFADMVEFGFELCEKHNALIKRIDRLITDSSGTQVGLYSVFVSHFEKQQQLLPM